jgi:hypothetical protein
VDVSRLSVQVRDDAGNKVPVTIVKNGDGTFSVTYIPTGTSPLILSASFDGKPLFDEKRFVVSSDLDVTKTTAEGALHIIN